MGHDLSKVVQQFECNAVGQHVLDLDDDTVSTMTPSTCSDEEFLTHTASLAGSSRTATKGDGNAIIVFDWDDTLLCSTAINRSTWTLQELGQLENAIESILHHAMTLGETLIVTNGNATWVKDSATRFLPRVLPTLAKIQCVSARAMYERTYPGDPYMWKQAAFSQLLTQDRTVSPETGMNLVAIGDQMPEIEAAYYVVDMLGSPSKTKTVKFKEQPSIQELLGQLNRTERELSKLVAEKTSGNRCLVRRELPPHLERAVSQAAGWKFSSTVPSAQSGDGDKPQRSISMKDFWPLFQ